MNEHLEFSCFRRLQQTPLLNVQELIVLPKERN